MKKLQEDLLLYMVKGSDLKETALREVSKLISKDDVYNRLIKNIIRRTYNQVRDKSTMIYDIFNNVLNQSDRSYHRAMVSKSEVTVEDRPIPINEFKQTNNLVENARLNEFLKMHSYMDNMSKIDNNAKDNEALKKNKELRTLMLNTEQEHFPYLRQYVIRRNLPKRRLNKTDEEATREYLRYQIMMQDPTQAYNVLPFILSLKKNVVNFSLIEMIDIGYLRGTDYVINISKFKKSRINEEHKKLLKDYFDCTEDVERVQVDDIYLRPARRVVKEGPRKGNPFKKKN